MCKVDIFKIDAEKVLFILNDKTLQFLAGTNGFRSYGVTNEGSTEISDSTEKLQNRTQQIRKRYSE